MNAPREFGANIEAQLAANRQTVQAGVASIGGRIWPQNNPEYGGPTPIGTRLQGQIIESVRDFWDSGDPRIKVVMRGEDGVDYNVTLSKFSHPDWEKSPGKVGDWIVFEVVSVKPGKNGKYYVETAFALERGTGVVTLASATADSGELPADAGDLPESLTDGSDYFNS